MKSWRIICVLLLCTACFFVGRRTRQPVACGVIRADTITIRDTLRDSVPYPIYETLIREVPEHFPVYITRQGDTVHDTIYIPVPISQKEYATDNYRAWVSGYNAALDSIDVFPKTAYITKKVPVRKWGLGLIGGYGIGQSGLSPYIGIGGYYRIW